MTETMMVQVTLIPCTTEITAHPGDKLMVMNGQCIGVYSGTGPTKSEMIRRTAKAHRVPVVEHGLRSMPASDVRGLPTLPAPSPTTTDRKAIAEQILNIVAARPGISTTDLMKFIGAPKDGNARWQHRDVAKQLVKSGLLVAEVISPQNPRLGSRYTLKRKAQPAEPSAEEMLETLAKP